MKKSALLILLVFWVLAACNFEPENHLAEHCSKSIESMADIQDRVKWGLTAKKRFEIQEGGPRKQNWLDVNEFLNVLPYLRVQEGYTLDYIQFQGENGSPMLYIRKTGEFPYSSFDDYQKYRLQKLDAIADSSFTEEERARAYESFEYQYMNFIQTDGSPESFVEFVLFRSMGDQFYLMWHANYDDGRPVCSISNLERKVNDLISQYSDDKEELNQLIMQAKEIDLSPVVEFEKDVVKVRIYIFTQFGGLYQHDLTIVRNFPHLVLDEEFDLVLPYESGIRY